MNDSIVKTFVKAIKAEKKDPSPYDTTAKVTRVEGNTVWVHISGGVDETPVRRTVNAKVGDEVQVRVGGGKAWITGNASSPPTDDTRAIKADANALRAKDVADSAFNYAETAADAAGRAITSATQAANAAASAQTSANNAQISANNAQTSANNAAEYASRALGGLSTVQSVAETLTWITQHGTMTLTTDVALDPTHVYFVRDNDGDYEVGAYKYSIVAEPDVADIATYYELTIDESLNNYVGTHLALTNEGLWLLPASTGTNKMLIATGDGTTYTTAGTYIIDSNGATVASFRANGATMGENMDGKSRSEISTTGMQIYQKVNGADVELANIGYGAGKNQSGGTSNTPHFTFGKRRSNTTIGNYSFATGYDIEASHYLAYAEGNYTSAKGSSSHAEGTYTTAQGYAAHVEGNNSVANGEASHAQNTGTVASRRSQTVIGEYNISDTTGADGTVRGQYALIIGNGDQNTASNALTVDWNGNVNIPSGSNYMVNNVPIGVLVDYESSLTPTIDSRGVGMYTCKVTPSNSSDVTALNAVQMRAFLINNANVYPLIITYATMNSSGYFTINMKSIHASVQSTTSSTIHGTLHVVAPFAISSVTAASM